MSFDKHIQLCNQYHNQDTEQSQLPGRQREKDGEF
jgi:hypothetical protein